MTGFVEFFNGFLDFIYSGLSTVFQTIFSPIIRQIDNFALTEPSIAGYKDFLSATINLLVPYRAVIICIGILAPVYAANLSISLVLLVKSWMPLMGGGD